MGAENRELSSAALNRRASESGRGPEPPLARVASVRTQTRFFRSRFARLAFTLILVFVAAVLRAIIAPLYDWFPPFFLPGVVIALATLLGDMWAGFFATALWMFFAIGVPVSLRGGHLFHGEHEVLGLAMAASMGIFFAALLEALQRNRETLAARLVDEAQKTADALQAERQRFFTVLESLPTMIALISPDYRVVFANSNFRDRFGDVGNRHCYEAFNTDNEPCSGCKSRWVLETRMPAGWESIQSDGAVLAIRDIPFTDCDGSPLILEMLEDITERRRVEDELREYRERLEMLVEERTGQLLQLNLQLQRDIAERERTEKELRASQATLAAAMASLGEALVITDAKGKYLDFNEAFASLCRFPSKAECAKGLSEIRNVIEVLYANGEAVPLQQWAVPRALRGESGKGVEYTIRRRDTGETWINSHTFNPVRDREGAIIGSVMACHDITEQKRTEKLLEATLARFYLILSNLKSGVMLVNSDAKVEFVNQAFCDFFNLQDTPEALIGLPSPDMTGRLLPAFQNPEEMRRRFRQLVERGETVLGDEHLLRNGLRLLTDFVPLAVTGNFSGRLWVATDVTALTRTGQALVESQKQNKLLGNLILASSQPLWVSPPGKPLSFANHAFEELTGYSRQELKTVGRRQILSPPEWAELDMQKLAELNRTGKPVRYEKEYLRKDGVRVPVEVFLHLAKDPLGKPIHHFAFITDITMRKQAEAELKRLNRMLKALIRSNQALSHATAEAAYLHEVCRLVLEDCGNAIVWIGRAAHDDERSVIPVACAGIDADDLKTLEVKWDDGGNSLIGTAIRTGEPCIRRNIFTDPKLARWRESAGRRGYVSSMAIPIRVQNEIWGAISIYSAQTDAFSDAETELLAELVGDIEFGIQAFRTRAAQIAAEEELRMSEERLGLFVEHAPAAIAMFDRDMRYLYTSRRWNDDYGVSHLDLRGRLHYEVFPEIPEKWKQGHRRALDGEVIQHSEDRFDRSDGTVQWVQSEVRPWYDVAGKIGGILISAEDITERRRVEEALRESEARFRSVLDNSVDFIYRMNLQTSRYEYISPSVQLVLGRSREEMMAGTREDTLALVHPDDLPTVVLVFNRLETTRKEQLEYRELNSDGQYHWMSNSMFLQCDPAGRPLYCDGSIRDITELKQAEIALRESERKLRELAGSLLTAQEDERRSLARELHDDLTQQLAFLSMELGNVAIGPPALPGQAQERIQALQRQALRASKEMRRISHGLHPSAIEDFGLSIALEEFCEEFMTAQGVFVEFEGLVDDSGLNDRAAACLYRIAQESLRNAAVHGHATRISVTLHLDGDFIQLRVEDNGSGFLTDPNHRKKGLGVISMTERVRLVNGTLTIFSQPGQGTEVSARVPIVGADHEAG